MKLPTEGNLYLPQDKLTSKCFPLLLCSEKEESERLLNAMDSVFIAVVSHILTLFGSGIVQSVF